MLDKQTVDTIKKTIKEINKEKDLNQRLIKMIDEKDKIRFSINEELDELFSEIELKSKKKNFYDDDFF